MEAFVVLYRGINVGGKCVVKMERLRALHEQLGHRDVKSYVQSGNIVFRAKGAAATLAKKTAAAFEEEFGFAATLLVVEAKRWQRLIDENPFAKEAARDPTLVHLGVCQGEPEADALTALLAKTKGSEQFVVKPGALYLYAPDGFGKSKFAAGMERAGGAAMTVRNWRSAVAITELLDELSQS